MLKNKNKIVKNRTTCLGFYFKLYKLIIMRITDRIFFKQDAEALSQELIGKFLCCQNGKRYMITETECYKGADDTACHARFGKTKRNQVMWGEGGYLYVYLCYGIHFMLNIVSGDVGEPEGVFIRGVDKIFGPGRVSKALGIDLGFYGEDLISSKRIWVEDGEKKPFANTKRIGIDYAQKEDRERLWRFVVKDE